MLCYIGLVVARIAARAVATGLNAPIGAHRREKQKEEKKNNITAYNVVNKSFSFILAVTRALAILLLNTNGKSTVHMRWQGWVVWAEALCVVRAVPLKNENENERAEWQSKKKIVHIHCLHRPWLGASFASQAFIRPTINTSRWHFCSALCGAVLFPLAPFRVCVFFSLSPPCIRVTANGDDGTKCKRLLQ